MQIRFAVTPVLLIRIRNLLLLDVTLLWVKSKSKKQRIPDMHSLKCILARKCGQCCFPTFYGWGQDSVKYRLWDISC
jgi:hypothetical protein